MTEVFDPKAKRAELSYQILDREKLSDEREAVLAEIRLKTGRHHQIRVQMAHAGLPLAGDRKYGAAGDKGQNPALCAVELSFSHPVSGQRLCFKTDPRGAAFAIFARR